MARWHSLWLTSDLAPEVERELNIERLRAIARHQPLAAAAHAGMSLALAAAVTLLRVPARPVAVREARR